MDVGKIEDHIGRVSPTLTFLSPLSYVRHALSRKSLHLLYMQQLRQVRWTKNIRGKKGLDTAEMDETRQKQPKIWKQGRKGKNDPKIHAFVSVQDYWFLRCHVTRCVGLLCKSHGQRLVI